jgi:hypothetical protein
VDDATQTIFASLIATRRTLGLYSEMVTVLELTEETTILSGAGNTVLVDQSLTPGLNRTVTRDGGVTDPFLNAQADDIVQIAGVDYVIDTKVSNQIVTIKTSAGAGAGQVLNNIRHPLTTSEQVVDYGTRAAAFADREITVVFPPEPTWNSEVVDGFLLAAATAGLRGYTIPQQGLTGVQLEDGWGAPQSAFEFLGYLDTLAAYGVFVYEQTDQLSEPNAIVYKSNTTDQSETIKSREGLVANEDAIRRYLEDQLSCYNGRVKVVTDLLGELYVAASDAVTYLVGSTIVDPFGPVLISGTVGNPTISTTSADIVIIPISGLIAANLEDIDLQIEIEIQATV